jgi:hypothetical protein
MLFFHPVCLPDRMIPLNIEKHRACLMFVSRPAVW